MHKFKELFRVKKVAAIIMQGAPGKSLALVASVRLPDESLNDGAYAEGSVTADLPDVVSNWAWQCLIE